MWRSLLLHTHGAFFSQLLIARGLSFNFNTSIAGWRMDPLKMRFLLIRDFQPAILVYPDVRLMVFFPDVLSHNKLEKMSMLLPAGLFVLWCMTSKTHQKTIEWISQHFRRKCNCLFHTITIKMVEWPLCFLFTSDRIWNPFFELHNVRLKCFWAHFVFGSIKIAVFIPLKNILVKQK